MIHGRAICLIIQIPKYNFVKDLINQLNLPSYCYTSIQVTSGEINRFSMSVFI